MKYTSYNNVSNSIVFDATKMYADSTFNETTSIYLVGMTAAPVIGYKQFTLIKTTTED